MIDRGHSWILGWSSHSLTHRLLRITQDLIRIKRVIGQYFAAIFGLIRCDDLGFLSRLEWSSRGNFCIVRDVLVGTILARGGFLSSCGCFCFRFFRSSAWSLSSGFYARLLCSWR